MNDRDLDELERAAFGYFVHEIDSQTGLVLDNTRPGVPATIAGSGFSLTCYVIGAARGYLSRAEAAECTHTALRFLLNAPQADDPGATGYRGFFYHFLAPDTGKREWHSEISTIDSAIAFAGVLTASVYFDADVPVEREIRAWADLIYRRAEWDWATDGRATVALGWCPETGFSPWGWGGYTEALLLYILGLGSPTHPLSPDQYTAWTKTYRWSRIFGHDLLYAGPLFIHHLTQCWIDFRKIQDDFMRDHGIDYFENSRRATHVHQEYAKRNPRKWTGYSATCWGITASDGPGPAIQEHQGRRRRFYRYHARGAPFGPDDGTLSPWSMVASLPFAPEIVLPSITAIAKAYPELHRGYGYTESFNPSFKVPAGSAEALDRGGWMSPAHYAINQGPVVLMIENYRSGMVWDLMRRCPYIVDGLRRAGFRGGWLA